MKRQKYKIISIFLLLSAIAMMLSGCSEDNGSGYTFKMNLAGNPQNLDPQLAVDMPSKIVISNMMSGLVRISDTGAIEPDAAESYSISEDELTYTFEIKNNIYWESENGYKAKLTADDFVFAFQRIFDNEALFSPYVDDFLCIKNSTEVSQGILDKSELGVKALSDYTLQIELEYPYCNFLELLTSTSAMPCNRRFFESTKGRYGLSADTTVSNGGFYLKEWNYDAYWDNNYIIMRRNKSNSGADYVYPYSLNFFITKNSDSDADDFSSGAVDCFITDNYDKKIFKSSGYNSYSSKSYGLLFNVKSQYFKNQNLRYALASSFSREAFSGIESEACAAAYGIIPSSITVMGRSYRDIVPDRVLSIYDKDNAFTIWNDELAAMNTVSVDGIKITVPESFTETDYLNIVTEQWQQNLEFFCGVEVVSQNEYELKISEGTFDILFVEIGTTGGGAIDYMNYFTGEGAEITGYMDYRAMSYEQSIKKAGSLSEATRLYNEAESNILNSAVYIPLLYGNEYFVCGEDMRDIVYSPMSRTVYFRYAKNFD